MTVTRDVTRYASMLQPGSVVAIGAATSEYDQAGLYTGAQHVWVNLSFYEDPAASLSEGAASAVVPAYTNGWICGSQGVGTSIAVSNVTFGPSANTTLEFYATNHGSEEGYVMSRHFDVAIDGHPLTTVYTFPYRYAWVGQYGGDQTIHPVVWWSAFQAADVAGAHTGVGQIPPYRLALDASQMALLSPGPHTVTVTGAGMYNCEWITSLAFLEHAS
jgi:hypothetical protein